MWFEKLMGFPENSYEDVQRNIIVDGEKMTSIINGKTYRSGRLEIPSLENLRKEIDITGFKGSITINEVVGNVGKLHCEKENNGAVFQAASQ